MDESISVDPLKVFKLSKDYTISDLTTRFRELASMYHPEKNNQQNRSFNEKMYALIKKCYIKLLQNRPPSSKSQSKFDLEKFNKVFEQYKIVDAYEKSGYDKWCEKHSDDSYIGSGAIVHNDEPEALNMGGEFYELGVEHIDNFSGNTGSQLEFTDYKLAHSTSKLVDERFTSMPKYKTLDEIKAERSQITFDLSPQKAQELLRREEAIKRAELRREQILMKQDKEYNDHFKKVESIMLGR